MYRMALCVFMLPSSYNTNKLIKMALVHDLGESIVGDITPHDNVSLEDKRNKELIAMKEITELIPEWSRTEIMSLWQEYEESSSFDARVVKDLDKFDMIMQGFEYEKKYQKDLSCFFEGINIFRTEIIRNWAQELYLQREAYIIKNLN